VRVQKLIGFDCDEVLANFHIALEKFVHLKYGSRRYSLDEITSYHETQKLWGCSPEEAGQRILEFYDDPTGLIGISPVAGALEVINKINLYHRMVVITLRPPSTEEETRKWFDIYFPNIFEDIFFLGGRFSKKPRSKGEVCKEIGVDVFVDDHIKYIKSVSEVGIPSLLFDRPWNRNEGLPPLTTRVFGWKNVLEHLL